MKGRRQGALEKELDARRIAVSTLRALNAMSTLKDLEGGNLRG